MACMTSVAMSHDGLRIHYDVCGEGSPAIVFIHGGLSKRTQWRNQVDHFARRHTTVALDLAGHGESEAGRDAWTMEAFGGDVVAVAEHLGLESVVLAGHSMGGVVMLEAAVRMPEKVIGLIGVDTLLQRVDKVRPAEEFEAFLGPLREDFQAAARREGEIRFLPQSDPAVVRQVLDDIASMNPGVGMAEMENLFSTYQDRRTTELLQQVTAPITIVAPDWRPFDVEAARRHGIDVEFIPDTGHWIQMEAPEAINDFIARTVAQFTNSSSESRTRQSS